jgi:hypothetical protein
LNILHLTEYGVKAKVNNLRSRSELIVTDGRETLINKLSDSRFKQWRLDFAVTLIFLIDIQHCRLGRRFTKVGGRDLNPPLGGDITARLAASSDVAI